MKGMRVTIYWRTKDGGLIDRIRQRFGQLDELKVYERQGFIQLRYKNK